MSSQADKQPNFHQRWHAAILDHRHVAVWTILGSIATVVGLIVTLVPPRDPPEDPVALTPSAPASMTPTPTSPAPGPADSAAPPSKSGPTASPEAKSPPRKTPEAEVGTAIAGPDADENGFVVYRDSRLAYDRGSVHINGKVSAQSYWAAPACCDANNKTKYNTYIDINLKKQYRTLTGHLGVIDKSFPNQAVRFEIYADGKKVFDRSLVLGQSVELTHDIANVTWLRIGFSGLLYKATGAIGDPTVFA